jgi:organic radical activating enzyme
VLPTSISLSLRDTFTIGFVYNYPCPLQCDFCCHTKENVGPGKLTRELIKDVVLRFAPIPEVTRFAFTGGDPMIYVKDIVSVFREARAAGVKQPFHVVTSGFWAKDLATTTSKLAALQEVGLDSLNLSYDREHQKWVPKDYVLRILEVCQQLNIALDIFGVFWDQDDKVQNLVPEIASSTYDRLSTHSVYVAPIGRARENYKARKNFTVPAEAKSKCFKPGHYDVSVYPNGDAYPCCSGGYNKEAKLLLGNAFVDDAKAILEKASRNFHVRIAKEIGFDVLLKEIDALGIKVDLPTLDEVETVCEMCALIHSDQRIKDKIAEAYDSIKMSYALQKLDSITDGETERSNHG